MAAVLGLAVALLATQAVAAPRAIVLIDIDDVGAGTIGPLGRIGGATPNIDAIGQAGVTFTQATMPAAYCAPSRAGVMTGRPPASFGFPAVNNPSRNAPGVPAQVPMLATMLRARGYTTGLVGKWHLGYKAPDHPMRRGFDEFFGFVGSVHPYYGEDPDNPILRGFQPEPSLEYLTTRFGHEAASFIQRHAGGRFALVLTPNGMHTPLEAPSDSTGPVYDSMMRALDDAVGEVLSALRQAGLERDTLVIFTSDNGCPRDIQACSNGGLRGAKGSFYEGGIRVPLAIRWPARIKPGKVYGRPVSGLDLLATMLGEDYEDGRNLVPYVNGVRIGDPHRCQIWGNQTWGAFRCGDWKLVILKNGVQQLFNLATDPSEQLNVAGTNQTKLKDLQAKRQAKLASW